MAANLDTKTVLMATGAGAALLLGATGVMLGASAKKEIKQVDTRVSAIEGWQAGCIASGITPAFGAYTPGAGYDGKVIG